jgi:hypothetical protein
MLSLVMPRRLNSFVSMSPHYLRSPRRALATVMCQSSKKKETITQFNKHAISYPEGPSSRPASRSTVNSRGSIRTERPATPNHTVKSSLLDAALGDTLMPDPSLKVVDIDMNAAAASRLSGLGTVSIHKILCQNIKSVEDVTEKVCNFHVLRNLLLIYICKLQGVFIRMTFGKDQKKSKHTSSKKENCDFVLWDQHDYLDIEFHGSKQDFIQRVLYVELMSGQNKLLGRSEVYFHCLLLNIDKEEELPSLELRDEAGAVAAIVKMHATLNKDEEVNSKELKKVFLEGGILNIRRIVCTELANISLTGSSEAFLKIKFGVHQESTKAKSVHASAIIWDDVDDLDIELVSIDLRDAIFGINHV